MDDILDLGSEATPSDASSWATTLEMIFATVQGPAPPAPMQLEIARQARSLVEQIILAPRQEPAPGASWIAIAHANSAVLMSGERSVVAHLQMGSVVTLDIGIPDQTAWSIAWDSPGAAAESLLSGVLSGGGGGLPAQPAVRIGIFQGDRRVAETSFDLAGGWQDDLDDQALTDEVNRRLEEAGQGIGTPEEGGGAGSATLPGSSSAGTPPGSSGASGISSGVLAGAAAVAGVAAAAIAREVIKKRAEPERPAPPSPPPPPVFAPPPVRQWHYMQGSKQEGPVTEPDLRQLVAAGTVRADTLVWNESLANWTTAGQAGLVAQPPVGPCPRCGVETSPGARFCRSCGQPLG